VGVETVTIYGNQEHVGTPLHDYCLLPFSPPHHHLLHPSRCIRHPATSSPFDIVSALSSSRFSQSIPGPSSTRLLMVTAQPADDGKKGGARRRPVGFFPVMAVQREALKEVRSCCPVVMLRTCSTTVESLGSASSIFSCSGRDALHICVQKC
jgi:hypothetical protein